MFWFCILEHTFKQNKIYVNEMKMFKNSLEIKVNESKKIMKISPISVKMKNTNEHISS